MRTVRDSVVPVLEQMLPHMGLEPDRAGKFWSLFELLTRESLTYPIAPPRPQFSGICADGTPWQFCLSLGAAVSGGVRYLTEIGLPGSPLSTRTRLTRLRLAEVFCLLDLPEDARNAAAALFALLPESTEELDNLNGGIWVAVACGTDGEPKIRLYANNEWGDESSRWRRLVEVIRTLNGFGFGRFLRSHVSELASTFSPVGLAVTLGRELILKLYLRPKCVPWRACSTLSGCPAFGIGTDLVALLEKCLRRRLDVPIRALVLSLGATASGENPDFKLDFCGYHLFRSESEARETIERLACETRIDLQPYYQTLGVLDKGAPGGYQHFESFFGVGGGRRGLRLNIYLRPPDLTSCQPADAVSDHSGELRRDTLSVPRSRDDRFDHSSSVDQLGESCGLSPPRVSEGIHMARAVTRALEYLVNSQREGGQWADFQLPVGTSTTWVTAYVGNALILAHRSFPTGEGFQHAIRRAASFLVATFRSSGWGFNETTESDADSSALAVLFLRESGCNVESMRSALLQYRTHDGGYGTFRKVDHDNCWASTHADVLPTVLRALGSFGSEAGQTLLRTRSLGGHWRSYWWTTDLYATQLALNVLARTPLSDNCQDSRAWLLERVDSVSTFDRALCLSALQSLPDDPVTRDRMKRLRLALLDSQNSDGSWPASASLRVPDFGCSHPWETPSSVRVYGDFGLFTTATAILALSQASREIRDPTTQNS